MNNIIPPSFFLGSSACAHTLLPLSLSLPTATSAPNTLLSVFLRIAELQHCKGSANFSFSPSRTTVSLPAWWLLVNRQTRNFPLLRVCVCVAFISALLPALEEHLVISLHFPVVAACSNPDRKTKSEAKGLGP